MIALWLDHSREGNSLFTHLMNQVHLKFTSAIFYKCTVLIWMVLFIVVVADQNISFAEGPEVSRGKSEFYKAEGLFHAGKIKDARILFNNFLRKYPGDPLNVNALLRIGEIDLRNRSFISALRHLDLIETEFPDTPLIHYVRFRKAECYFQLERFKGAKEIFREALKSNPDMSQKWRSLLYLGSIDEEEFDYRNALKKLLYVVHKSEDENLIDQSVKMIERIVREKLTRENLVALASKYRAVYPGDLILLKLISIFRLERDYHNYLINLENFSLRFPDHAQKEVMEKALSMARKNKKRSLKLGAVLPLSGKRALAGQQVLQGIQLAFNQLTLSEKDKIELVVRDSQSVNSVEQILEELAIDPNMIGVVGPVLSDEVKKIIPVIDRYKLPVFTPTASSLGITELSPYVFRNALTREIQAKFLARYFVNDLNLHRVVIFHSNESYGEDLKDIFSDEVQALGGEVVALLSYDRTQTDFKEQILKIGGISDDKLKALVKNQIKSGVAPGPLNDKGKYSRPVVERGLYDGEDIEGLKVSLDFNYDAIFIPGFYDKVALIVPQLAFYNIEKPTLLGASGWNSPELVKNARQYLKTAVFVDGFFIDSEQAHIQEFVTKFRSTFGEDPTILSAQAYDAAMIYLKLIRDGARNRILIKKRLHTIHSFPGVSGTTTILPSGDVDKLLTKLRVKGRKIVQID